MSSLALSNLLLRAEDPTATTAATATSTAATTTANSNNIAPAAATAAVAASSHVLDSKVYVGNIPIDAIALDLKKILFPNTQVLVRPGDGCPSVEWQLMNILACSNITNPIVDSKTTFHVFADFRSPLDAKSAIQRLGKLSLPLDFRNALDSDDYPAWHQPPPPASREMAQSFLRSQGWLLNALREQALENGLDVQIIVSPRNDNRSIVYDQLFGGRTPTQENLLQLKDHETTCSDGKVALASQENARPATSSDPRRLAEKSYEERWVQLVREDSVSSSSSAPPVQRTGKAEASASPGGSAEDLCEPPREPATHDSTSEQGTLLPPVNCPRLAHVGPTAKQEEMSHLAIAGGGGGSEEAEAPDFSASPSLACTVDHSSAPLLRGVDAHATFDRPSPVSESTDGQHALSILGAPSHPYTPSLNVTSTATPIAKRQELHRQLSSEDLTKALLGVISEAPVCYGNEPMKVGKNTPAIPGNPEISSKLQEAEEGETQCAETNPEANQTVKSPCTQSTDVLLASIGGNHHPLDCDTSRKPKGVLPKPLPGTAGIKNNPPCATYGGAGAGDGAGGGSLVDTAKSPTCVTTESEDEYSEDLPTGLFVCGCKSEQQILREVIPAEFRYNVVFIQGSPDSNFFVVCFDGPTIAKQIVGQLPQGFVETDFEKRTRHTPFVKLLLKDDLGAIIGRRLAGLARTGQSKVDMAAKKGYEISAGLGSESKSVGE